MINPSNQKSSRFMGVVGIALILACLFTAFVSIPNAHASSRIGATSTQRSDTCDAFTYLGGSWPARFRLANCAISFMQQNNASAGTIEGLVSLGLEECNVVCTIGSAALAWLINREINHLADESKQCGNQGVFIHLYGVVFRSSPVCVATTDLPVLNASYNNYSVRRQDGATFNETIDIDSQDPEGNITARWLTLDVTYYCQGNATAASDVSLNCTSNNSFNFTGHIYDDGHIEGTSVGVDTGNIYDEYMR